MVAPKITVPSQGEIRNPEVIETPSKKVWIVRPASAVYATRGIHKLLGVGLFTKMEMRGPRMFKVVDNEVSQQNQRRAGSGRQAQAFRHHLRERRRQHETRAQRNEKRQKVRLQGRAETMAAPNKIGETRHEAQRQADPKIGHGERFRCVSVVSDSQSSKVISQFRFERVWRRDTELRLRLTTDN